MMAKDDFAALLARTSDRICSRILHEDIEWIDVEIDIDKMRERVRSQCPEKTQIFERVYGSRFRRLWQQWRRDIRPLYSRFD